MVERLSCPGPELLQRLLAGDYRDPEVQWLEEHLAQCSYCLATVSTLRMDDGLSESARDSAAVAEILREPVDESLLARLYRLAPSGTEGWGATQGGVPHQLGWETHAGPLTEQAHDFLAPPQGPGELGRLAGYRVLKLLGAGGMGVVLQAEDLLLKRWVALKAMHPSLAASVSARKRFLREAQALAAIRHEHVVPIYEVGEDRGIPFLAMPLLHGENLEQRLQREGRLPLAEVLRIGREAAEGLAAAHSRGLIHRDIKPANIWLEARDEIRRSNEASAPTGSCSSYRVQLLDFGLARTGEGQGNLTGTGVPIGTPAYMAPEQCRGEVADARSDLFSLGIILYRMGTGKLPFKGLDRASSSPPPPREQPASPHEFNPDMPPALADVILQLLAWDPALRPASAEEVADRLLSVGPQPAAVPPAVTGPRPAAAGAWKRSGLAAAVALVVLLPVGYFVGGSVFRFATNQGQVVIEVNDPDTEVTLKEGGAVIQDGKAQRQVTLSAGRHELEVRIRDAAGEVRFFSKVFLLRRGGKEIVNVHQELDQARLAAAKSSRPDGKPPEPSAAGEAGEAERRATLWALSRGAKGTILVGDAKKDLALARDLPAGAFRVVNVRFGPESKPSDPELDRLQDLPHLTSLKLQAPWVSDASLARLKSLVNLRRLDVVAREVSDAGLLHLQGLTNLDHLLLINTSVTGAGLVHLKAFPNLKHLELSGTRVTEAGVEHLVALPGLTGWLTLDNCGVTDAGLERLKTLTRLTGLRLANNPVSDAGLAGLEAMSNLEELDLCQTGVSDAGLVHLKALRNLQRLRLAKTAVSDAGLAKLEGLRNLVWIDLCGTRVTDAGLISITALAPAGPFEVLLQGTRVSSRGVADFKGAFPRATIQWWEPNRSAAEAILAAGGSIHVRRQNQSDDWPVRAAAELPQEYFWLTRASLVGVRKPLGEVLAKVAALNDPQFDGLDSLDLSGSAVTDADLVCLDRLSGLRRLVLDATGIRIAGLVHLRGLTHLRELRLGCQGITDLGAGVICRLKELQRLSMAGSGLTDMGLGVLKELSALQELDLTSTKVTAEGVAALQKALPKCRIRFEPAASK
jgi:tRNA A-37 threonylcarbamoyl transferase component Bud32/Leucine-rich repeat (LRR) protein